MATMRAQPVPRTPSRLVRPEPELPTPAAPRRAGRLARHLVAVAVALAADGSAFVLPHTWPRNSTHEHQGRLYHVDHAGQYHVRGADGWWYPIQR